jgi:transcriptional regulator of acetoin/glycerol metabolism
MVELANHVAKGCGSGCRGFDPRRSPQKVSELVVSLANAAGNIAMVARELGKDRTQVWRWMKRFGLRRD